MTDRFASQTARFIEEAQLFGLRAFQDEIDTRPMPDERQSIGAVHDMFDALAGTLQDTRMEPDLEELLWATVNIFHRAAERISAELDRNELEQRDGQQRQDGSEIAATELERLIAIGRTLIDRRNWLEAIRDEAADLFGSHTGSAWRPRTGSKVNTKHLTSAYIDSRDFQAANRAARTQVLVPPGPKVAVIGGAAYQDIDGLFGRLDKIRARYPEMVLLHGGSEKGAELIADRWAGNRGVPRIAFKPEWRRGKSAPFKRNDALLETVPVGIVVFDGGGVVGNLVDKARAAGIKLWDLRTEAR